MSYLLPRVFLSSETGAVDNTACRDFCGLDTLSASQVLRRLRDRDLLQKKGAGSQTLLLA